MKYFEFIDKTPDVGKLAVVEGTEQLFSDRVLAVIEERLLDPAARDLNSERFVGPELESMEPVAAACAAMPFLGSTRLVVVRRAHEMRAASRRALWDVAQAVPEGNTLVIEDLQSPAKRSKPETFGQLAGRTALRIDVTATGDARARYARETLKELGVTAEPAAIAALANGNVPLSSVQSDLEKLALCGPRITLDDLLRESIVAEDVKAYQAASALVEGRVARALALTQEMIAANGERGAAVPLLSAVATEYRLLWELARPGGELPERMQWRERVLRPIARRLGERGARLGYERAIRGFEALVTGRLDDVRTVMAVLVAEAAFKDETTRAVSGREPPGVQTTGGR